MYYSRRTAMNKRFQACMRRQRAAEAVINVLSPFREDGGHLSDVIAFGRNYFGRRCKRGDVNDAPVCKSIRRRLAASRRVVLIDEYFTSQKCHKCGHQLDMNDETRVGACTGCPESWDRDVNAAKNMKLVFNAQVAGAPRPAFLWRPVAVAAA